LYGGQARRVEVLDHLHYRRRVVAGQALVAVGQRPVQQADALLLGGRQAVEPQPVARRLQGAIRDIHADDLLEGAVAQQRLQEAALAAAQVKHTPRAGLL
jgi:hypothetical protein